MKIFSEIRTFWVCHEKISTSVSNVYLSTVGYLSKCTLLFSTLCCSPKIFYKIWNLVRQCRRLKAAGEHKEKGLRLLTDRAVNNRWSVTGHEEEMWSSTPLSAFVIVFELLLNSEGFSFLDKGCLCSGSGEQRISAIILSL